MVVRSCVCVRAFFSIFIYLFAQLRIFSLVPPKLPRCHCHDVWPSGYLPSDYPDNPDRRRETTFVTTCITSAKRSTGKSTSVTARQLAESAFTVLYFEIRQQQNAIILNINGLMDITAVITTS